MLWAKPVLAAATEPAALALPDENAACLFCSAKLHHFPIPKFF
jgi:hypothetical protein